VTALCYACENGFEEIITLLLDSDADVQLGDPLCFAVAKSCLPPIVQLLNKGANLSANSVARLQRMVKLDSMKAVAKCLLFLNEVATVNASSLPLLLRGTVLQQNLETIAKCSGGKQTTKNIAILPDMNIQCYMNFKTLELHTTFIEFCARYPGLIVTETNWSARNDGSVYFIFNSEILYDKVLPLISDQCKPKKWLFF
jgi:hypothetical protein